MKNKQLRSKAKLKNLLVNSDFKLLGESWGTRNCSSSRCGTQLRLKSNGQVFGITQDFLLLSKSARVYFRMKVNIAKPVEAVFVGINVNGHLKLIETEVMTNNSTLIGVIADVVQENFLDNKLGVYFVVKSRVKDNLVEVSEPFLIDISDVSLRELSLEELKFKEYTPGFSYSNCLGNCKFSKKSFVDRKWTALKNRGTSYKRTDRNELIITTMDNSRMTQMIELKEGHEYLVKVLSRSLNSIGKCRCQVDENSFDLNSSTELEQRHMKFKAKNEETKFILHLDNSNRHVPMSYLVKSVMMIDLTESKMEDLDESDILQLFYV